MAGGYTYDELSRRTSVTYFGASIAYDYQDKQGDDNLGNELESVTNTFSGPATLTYDYTYDDVGNRLTMTVDSNDIHEYKYDMLYQLTDVNYPVANDTTYYYDALGNRTSVVNGGTTTYTLNSKGLNQYGTVGGVPYSYDNNGNLTNINNGQYEYAYDCENRLTDVNNTIGRVASYKYDFAGRRVKKITYDTNDQELATIHYVYDGDQVITEYDGEGTPLRLFIYGPGIDEPVLMICPGVGAYFYHYDALGSVVALSDTIGNVVESYSYDVFGQPSSTSSVGNPYFFTGRRYDEETSLYYYRARYYSPSIGRFLQTDPIGYAAGLNLYTYCYNNPVRFVDPSGEGLYEWLYTGDWDASDEAYEAGVQAAAEWLYSISPVLGGYASVSTPMGKVPVGVSVTTSWTMYEGASVAVRGKAQLKWGKARVGGQWGGKWKSREGFQQTKQGFVRYDAGVLKIDDQGNIKFGLPWFGLVLSSDEARWSALADAWAEILGLDVEESKPEIPGSEGETQSKKK